MARRREVERAKRRFLAETGERDWLQAVGIGRVEGRLGLVVSVRPGAQATASRMLNRLAPGVPVTMRAVEKISARAGEPGAGERDAAGSEELEALRALAAARLGATDRQ